MATVCSLPPDYATKLQGYKVLVAGATGKTGRWVTADWMAESQKLRDLLFVPAALMSR